MHGSYGCVSLCHMIPSLVTASGLQVDKGCPLKESLKEVTCKDDDLDSNVVLEPCFTKWKTQ